MSVIGVHFPGHRNRYYEQLIELERVVCKSALLGPVTLLGDFKAHLGKMCGERCGRSKSSTARADGKKKQQQKKNNKKKTYLSAVSFGGMASGPEHTYCSSEFVQMSFLIFKRSLQDT